MGDVPWRRLVGGGARTSILFEWPVLSGGWSRWTSPGRVVSMGMSPRESVGVLLQCVGWLMLSSRTWD